VKVHVPANTNLEDRLVKSFLIQQVA